MDRRTLLKLLGVLPGIAAVAAGPMAVRAQGDIERIRSGWRRLAPDGFDPPEAAEPVALSPDQWRRRLTDEQFDVLREAGTEPAFSSPLDAEKRDGLYVCAGCDLPLFSSAMKFDSGTGWPSFFTTIPGVFERQPDFLLLFPRTAYHCVRCGGHHGHLFDDGPPPTHERWCNNGVALRFVPASGEPASR